jgi:hypothetical protein
MKYANLLKRNNNPETKRTITYTVYLKKNKKKQQQQEKKNNNIIIIKNF